MYNKTTPNSRCLNSKSFLRILLFFVVGMSNILYPGISASERGLSRNVSSPEESPLIQGTYRAIVIGNNKYNDPLKVWRPLKTAVNDATAVAKILKNKYGFSDVKLLKNATRRQILSSLNKLQTRVKKHDSVLVYYAGHGWRNETTQEAYWIPVDAEGEEDSFYLSNVRIKEKLSVIADTAIHTLLISDSCFSGTLLDMTRGKAAYYNSGNNAYFKKVTKRKSVQILAAGGSEFVDDNYRGSGHSPFTYFLLKELDTNTDKHITLSSLALNVEQLVAKNSSQTPRSGALRLAGDEGGQFIFNLVGDPSPKVATAKKKAKPNSTPKQKPSNEDLADAEFAAWKKVNQEKPLELLAFINAHPSGAITEVAQIKYQSLLNKIDDLLKMAQVDMTRGRYVSPIRKNARYRYKTILELDRENQAAIKGLKKLVVRMLSRVKKKIRGRKYEDATELLDYAEEIDPSHRQIARYRKIIFKKTSSKKVKKREDNKRVIKERKRQRQPVVEREEVIAPPPSF